MSVVYNRGSAPREIRIEDCDGDTLEITGSNARVAVTTARGDTGEGSAVYVESKKEARAILDVLEYVFGYLSE